MATSAPRGGRLVDRPSGRGPSACLAPYGQRAVAQDQLLVMAGGQTPDEFESPAHRERTGGRPLTRPANSDLDLHDTARLCARRESPRGRLRAKRVPEAPATSRGVL